MLSHDKCITESARDGLPNSPPFVQCFCGAHTAARQTHYFLHHHYTLGLKVLLSNVQMKSIVLMQ